MAEVLRRARADAAAYRAAGFDGLVVENYGDAPFWKDRVPPETVAATALAAAAARDAAPGLAVGANVLRNDARAALAVAAAAGLDFVRVNVLAGAVATDQGLVEGRAAEVLRERARLCPGVRVLADVRVKHGRPLAERPIGDEARDLVGRGGADAVIVTGERTGAPAAPSDLDAVRAACPHATLLVGSGASPETVRGLLRVADGVIVGTAVKRGGATEAPVDPRRARAFVRAARGR
jgi:membrane complex biogenesis BtpA family protein